MQTMLQALAARRFDAIVNKHQRQPLLLHLTIKGTRPDREPENIFRAELVDIGEDFIEVRDRMISRDQIVEIQPINF